MNTRWIALVTVVAFLAAGTALAAQPQVKKIEGAVKLPTGVKIVKRANFKAIASSLAPNMVPLGDRLPFSCQQGGYDFYHKPRVIVVYKGTNPVQVPQLRIHWALQSCCEATVAAPTDNYMLYHNQGFYVYDGVPPNLNWPPEGQPPLACTAYGWIED